METIVIYICYTGGIYKLDVKDILTILEKRSDRRTKKVLQKHGAPEPLFGVKVGELRKIIKEYKLNNDTGLGLRLYNTGNIDAMYLAGLIVKPRDMMREDLQQWVEKARWYMISENIVPQVVSQSGYGFEMGLQWILSDKESIASAGWSTLSSTVLNNPDEDLNMTRLSQLLHYIELNLHDSPNRVRYTMNGFIIAVGSTVPDLTEKALSTADSIGKVVVDMGETASKVPDAATSIKKNIEKKSNAIRKRQDKE
jgi:3-methyladenine DNA glycosylase AlkD